MCWRNSPSPCGSRAVYAALIAGIWIGGHYIFEMTAPYLTALGGTLIAYLSFGLYERATWQRRETI
jgi:hypothetical protein